MNKSPHYINNKDFLKALIEYKVECADSIAKGASPRPNTKNYRYIGECFLLIATKMMNRPNFMNYSWKEDMTSDGIKDCVERMGNFDPKKSENPFAYFSQLCWNGAVRRIKTETKQKDIKIAILKNSTIINEGSDGFDDDEVGQIQENISSMLSCLEPQEKKPMEKKHKRTTKAHQKKLKEIDEKVAIAEKALNGEEPEDYENLEEVIDETEE